MTMKVKNLIVGGGFAGLYLASILEDATLIEATPNLGGLLRGFKSPSGRFTFDVGGHVYTTKDAALESILLDSDPVKFDSRMAFYDYAKMVPYPVQYFYELLGVLIPHGIKGKESYRTFAELLKTEFGKEFYNKVLGPFNQRVWSTDPSAMAADWVMGRVPLMKDFSSSWGPNSSFYYARGEDILDRLLNMLTEITIITDAELETIDVANKIAFISEKEPSLKDSSIEYENLFDTTGVGLALAGQRMPHNEVITVGVGLKRKLGIDFHWWYNAVDNSSPIHRITLLSGYHPKMAPPSVDSLLIEIPKHRLTLKTPYVKDNGDANIEGLLAILREANFHYIEEDDIDETKVIYSKGYPIPVIGHREKVAKARHKMAEDGIYLVGRWGAHGYYNLDHVIKDAIAAREASLGMSLNNYYWANYYYKVKKENRC